MSTSSSVCNKRIYHHISYHIILRYYVTLFLRIRVASRSNNFIVGLTNVSPNVSSPTLWNYTLCGQYPGAVPAAATVSLYCQDNLPPFRYVIVHFPRTDYMYICELEVLVVGMKMFWIFSALYAVARPSICPFVIRVNQSKIVEVRIMKFLPTVAPSLWFMRGMFHPEILTVSPERRRQTREGWGKTSYF